MTCRGIRGAVCVETNDAQAIIEATREMLERIVADNDLAVQDIACVIFTATPDLDTAYPARAAREMGWTTTPLLCEQEMVVKGGMPRCIRVLLLWNTELSAEHVRHVYVGKARALRPDLATEGRKQEAGSKRQDAGSKRQEAGSRKQEAGSRKQEAGSKKQA